MGFKRCACTKVCFVVIHVVERYNILIQNTAPKYMVHPKEQPGFGVLFCFKLQIYNILMISEPTFVLTTQVSFISGRALIFYSLWPCGKRIPEISSYTADTFML